MIGVVLGGAVFGWAVWEFQHRRKAEQRWNRHLTVCKGTIPAKKGKEEGE